jgi:hypothetical protein
VRNRRADLIVDSTLQGLVIQGPQPFSKVANEILPLHLERRYTGAQQERMTLSLGQWLSAVMLRRTGAAVNALANTTTTATTATTANALNTSNAYQGTTFTATTQFSGPGTGLTGTASSLTAGAANSVAYANVTGKPATGLYQVYSGTVSGGSGNGGTYTHVWQILYGGGSTAREMVSPDSFMVVTAVNDYYTSNNAGNYNSYTITKAVNLLNTTGSGDSRFTVDFIFSGYPTPNQINVTIYVQSATAVTSLVFVS